MKKMIITVIGTRGFPNIPGGVEKHCESLYGLIAKKYYKIHVFRRKPYVVHSPDMPFQDIIFHDLWAPKNKYIETIIHSLLAAFKSISIQPDLVHIHNIGPALSLPLLKLFKIKTVVTYHSDNYNHSKWNRFAKIILKTGEWFVNKLADEVIVVSQWQKSLLKDAKVTHIPNGIIPPERDLSIKYLKRYGIEPQKYIIAVSRFTPEKGLDLLVEAFEQIPDTGHKLVIAGDSDHESEYSRSLKKRIAGNPRIISTGYITGKPLNQLYSHAAMFVLPSYNEGLPISLLEAMSYGLSVLVSDISANREVGLHEKRYFICGNVKDLKTRLEALLPERISEKEQQWFYQEIMGRYNWEKIAAKTISVYESCHI